MTKKVAVAILLSWMLSLLFSDGKALGASAFVAGAASVNITPVGAAVRVPLGGYAARKGALAMGVHDPVFARALVLGSGGQLVAIVSVDLCFLPSGIVQAVAQDLRQMRLVELTGSHLFLAATHTHSAPDPLAMDPANTFTQPKGWSCFNPQLLRWTAYHIALAVKQAYENRVPALLGYTTTKVEGLNRNRRDDPVLDRQLTVLRVVRRKDLRSIAELVVFASHPTIYTAKMLEISADWPGVMEQAIEKRYGGVCLFLNGAEGDAAPPDSRGLTEEQAVEQYGKAVAAAVLRLIPTIVYDVPVPVKAWQTSVILPRRQPNGLYLAAAGSLGISIPDAQNRVRQLMPSTTTISFVCIHRLLLIGMPCEPTGALGVALRREAEEKGYHRVAIVALVNDWLAYALTAKQYQHGGYEAGMSFYGPQLGDVLERAVSRGLSQERNISAEQ
ncbi:Neutral/alkaline non-lysosomal ceramidase [Chthonomonas calidirosea]|uniref:neutral/alkaline non-lysosomal ceramidase N-terminal domain-containing protein n=1 Tax=Chthonomonas calidirosea TaxID=454171 RepID=UPI0006DD51B0|nr:neutral/alkaline non-lysosomal ceramidase N-terminal domain-containing protein [Chthonomonas calidirosea]CEK14784.1 Neutral/alkaline non-lysosomal ceramidase [Chthonomonas calidirosea]